MQRGTSEAASQAEVAEKGLTDHTGKRTNYKLPRPTVFLHRGTAGTQGADGNVLIVVCRRSLNVTLALVQWEVTIMEAV